MCVMWTDWIAIQTHGACQLPRQWKVDFCLRNDFGYNFMVSLSCQHAEDGHQAS